MYLLRNRLKFYSYVICVAFHQNIQITPYYLSWHVELLDRGLGEEQLYQKKSILVGEGHPPARKKTQKDVT